MKAFITGWKIRSHEISYTSSTSLQMQTYLLLVSVCDKIDQMTRIFVWEMLIMASVNFFQGLGILFINQRKVVVLVYGKLEKTIRPLFTKLCQQICKKLEKTQAKLLKSKYLHGRSLLGKEHVINRGPWIWNGIKNCKDFFLNGVCYQIKSASTLRIREDPWVPDLLNFQSLRQEPLDQYISLVCELMNEDGNMWHVNLIRDIFQ